MKKRDEVLAKRRKMEAVAEHAKLNEELRRLDAGVDKEPTGKGRKHMEGSGSHKSPKG